MTISREALFIIQTLQQAGFEAFIVGGAVRDLLLVEQGENSFTSQTDYDFATNATPAQIQALFPESFYENDFGTVGISPAEIAEQAGFSQQAETIEEENKQAAIDLATATKLHSSLGKVLSTGSETKTTYPNFEITTYRSQELYSNFRKPDTLVWGKSLQEDLTRRDFTINALALNIKEIPELAGEKILLPDNSYDIIDYHQGEADLKNHLIRTVGDPSQRFQEDALRMLRAIRFSVQLNFEIEENTFQAVAENAALLKHISWERISAEFLKMLSSSFPAEAIELLDRAGILSYVLPELLETKGVQQGGHHTTDVWTHSLDALRTCPSTDPIVRLATLLHDISKPSTYALQNGSITFYNHEVIGARVAKQVAERFHLSRTDQERIFTLVRYHMFHYQPENSDAAIRRFMRKVGLQNLNDILDLREGDRLGSGARQTSWRLEEMKERMREQLHQPLDVHDLAIDGTVLMTEFNLQPGKIIGETLNYLFEQILENPELNTPEELLKIAQEFLSKINSSSHSE